MRGKTHTRLDLTRGQFSALPVEANEAFEAQVDLEVSAQLEVFQWNEEQLREELGDERAVMAR